MSENRREEIKSPPRLERVQARTDYKTSLLKQIEASFKVLSASREKVAPGQVEAPEKILLALKRS